MQNPASFGLGGVQIVTRPGFGFNVMTVIAMTTASLLVMWLADQITQRGIGNGTSLIIMINITSRLPVAIIEAWTRYFGLGGITATRSPIVTDNNTEASASGMTSLLQRGARLSAGLRKSNTTSAP